MEKKTKINLLAIQMESDIAKLESNIQKVEALLKENLSEYKADFVFLPEVWTVGWDCESFPKCSEGLNDAVSIKMLQKMAKKYSTNIIGGSFIEKKSQGILANTCPVINREGNIVCTYEKNHLFSYYGCAEGDYITVGRNPIIVELDGVKIGLSICYDIRFPVWNRTHANDYDALIVPANWPHSRFFAWKHLLIARAIENQAYVLGCNCEGDNIYGRYQRGDSQALDFLGNDIANLQDDGTIYAMLSAERLNTGRQRFAPWRDADKFEIIVD